LYITIIETLILAVIMLILTVIEFKTSRAKTDYKQIDDAPSLHGTTIDVSHAKLKDDEYSRKLRQEALRNIIDSVKGNKNFMNKNNVEDVLDEQGVKRRSSMPPKDSEKEEVDVQPRSYPLTPKTKKEIEDDNPLMSIRPEEVINPEDYPDNCLYDSKPRNPMGSKGKVMTDAEI
jgi:hypothetical protein